MPRTHRVQLRRSTRLQNKTTAYTECTTDESSSSDNDDSDTHPSSNEESSPHCQPQYCICNQAQDHRIMICCDECNIWYHYNCVHLSLRSAKQLSLSKQKWFCVKCIHKRGSNKRKRRHVALSNCSPSSMVHVPPQKRHKPSQECNNNVLCTTDTDPLQTIVDSFFAQCLHTLISSDHNNALLFPFNDQFAAITDDTEHKEEEEICTSTDNTSSNIIETDSDSDIEILNGNISSTVVIKETEDTHGDGSDNDIEIAAGNEWIRSETFLENKEQYIQEMMHKKKEEIDKCLEDNDDDDDEREFVVLNDNKTTKQDLCPLTLKKIEIPIKNVCCPHVYEREAIVKYIEYMDKNEKKNKCPVPGCDRVLWIIC